MLEIQVRYRPISWVPFTRKANCNVPQNWGDVTQKQLNAIACLYKSTISDIGFMKAMSGLNKRMLSRLSDFEHFKLMEILEFIGEPKPHHEFIIRQLKLQWLWSLSLSKCSKPGLYLYAPGGKLKGVTFGQFIFTDTYFSNFQQSTDETDLNKFIASLYTGKNETFDERLIQERFESIGKLELNIRQAIVLNYQLIHEWLALAYPLIFQKREEMTNKDSPDRARPFTDGSPWIKVFQNFVGDDIIHDEVWAAKPVNTIFAYMTRKYKENARRGPS
jgi:hypothetical protein